MSSAAYVGTYVDEGSRNSFYHIVGSNKKYGFKEYRNQEAALWAWRVQSAMSEYNITPKVYGDVGRIRLRGQNELSKWGYLTETASVVRHCRRPNCCCDMWSSEPGCNVAKRIGEIVNILDEHYLDFHDGHLANFGIVTRNNRKIIVLIDCGVEGFGDYDRSMWGYAARGMPDSYYGCECTYCRRYV